METANRKIRLDLASRTTPGSKIISSQAGWRLQVPAGPAGSYRLAQLDDYSGRARKDFVWQPPVSLQLSARLPAADLPGTWGFGFWNDPFGLGLGLGGRAARLPCLPNAAWFFHASAPNHLSLHDGVPGSGFFAGTFHSLHVPSLLSLPALAVLPFLAIRPLARGLRRLAGRWIRQSGIPVRVDVTGWHAYEIRWLPNRCEFFVDGGLLLQTDIIPAGPLGLVLWIDNQYAAWRPDGRLGFGALANAPMELQMAELSF